jgi:hypothetical protein
MLLEADGAIAFVWLVARSLATNGQQVRVLNGVAG